MQDSSKFLTQGDTLYSISSTNNVYGYWISSPSAAGNADSVMNVNYYGYVD